MTTRNEEKNLAEELQHLEAESEKEMRRLKRDFEVKVNKVVGPELSLMHPSN